MLRITPTPDSYALAARLYTMFGNRKQAEAVKLEARRAFAEHDENRESYGDNGVTTRDTRRNREIDFSVSSFLCVNPFPPQSPLPLPPSLSVALLSQAPPPNVLLITIDTVRADHIGAYGYAKAATPVLDRLAREGVRFADATTQAPLTGPAHAALLTGLYPARIGVRDNATTPVPETRDDRGGSRSRRAATGPAGSSAPSS